jgi:SMC interacting uncharacterized protein involved in chromosome segregation
MGATMIQKYKYEELHNLGHFEEIDFVLFGDHVDEIERLREQNKALLEALKEVIKISDRKHEAWDKAKAAIARCEK